METQWEITIFSGKIIIKPRENHSENGICMRVEWENHGKSIEQPWENDGTWWFNGGLMVI